jgi:hypothetical protein
VKISKYWKGVIASASPVLLAVQAAVTDSRIDAGEWVAIGTAALIAVGVIATPNKPEAKPYRLPR